MAQYQNGPYYQQHQSPHGHQDPYNPRRSSFDAGDDQAYGTNGDRLQGIEYANSSLRGQTNTGAMRMNTEVFADTSSPRGSTGPPSATLSPLSPPSAHFSYNPQDYVQPSPPGLQHQPTTLTRTPSFPTQPPAPYNPADYSETNLQRVGSTAGYQHGFSPGYVNQTVAAQPPPSMPSPGLYQTVSNRPPSTHAARPTVQTSSFSSYTPPSRPSHYTPPAPPPLPAIPGSAESPSEDWGQIPTRYMSTSRRYGDTSTSTSSQPSYAAHSTRASLSSSTGQHQTPQSTPLPPQSAPFPTPPTPFPTPPTSLPTQSASLPTTPGPPPPPHGSTSYITAADQHLGPRPLPRLPSDPYPTPHEYFPLSSPEPQSANLRSEQIAQESLANEILGLTSQSPRTRASDNGINGTFSDEDTDPEALAGLEAMREADRQDAEDEARRRSGALTGLYRSSTFLAPAPSVSRPEAQGGSDSDVPFDLGSYGGGFDARMSYGGHPNQLRIARNESMSDIYSRSQPVSSSGSMRRSGHVSESETCDYPDSRQPFPPFSQARVDAFGTGGLADPSMRGHRRLSYDEGDEGPLLDYSSLAPGSPPPEIYYQSPPLTGRPLPPPPLDARGAGVPYPADYGSSHHIQFPQAPPHNHSYYQQASVAGPTLPRHTSLVSHSSTPHTIAPTRAITDAEARRRLQQRPSVVGAVVSDSSSNNTASASAVTLDLPSITKKFNPTKLGSRDFDRCREPWALSAIISWLKSMVEGEQFLKKQQLVDALVELFTYKVPTMNIADAETLGTRLIDEMHQTSVLYDEEEWLFFSEIPMTAVVFQLTGTGCYAPRLHDRQIPGRCYAYHCQRTEKKVDLTPQTTLTPDEDWGQYYKLKKEDVEGKEKKEIERQNILHEIVQKEENYLRELHTLLAIFRDRLKSAEPPVIGRKKLQAFIWDVFGKTEAVKKANEEHLLPQLKYRQKEQGPWIVGFSDIFREWIRKAKAAYLDYASQFPDASYNIRQEMERNVLFRTFLDRCREDPQSRRLGWDHYLKAPITRLQQLGFLLENALRVSVHDSDEKRNLQLAIQEVKAVTHECDMKVGDGTRRVEMRDLAYRLKLRPGMQRVELNLDHLGREVLFQGDLLRIGGSRFTWLETRAVLLDNYLVLAKAVTEKSPDGRNTFERYDVSRLPIPMDLLILESRDDDPVVRSTLAGKAGVTKVVPNPAAQEQLRLARTTSNQSPAPGSITTSQTSTSGSTLSRVTTTQSQAPTVSSIEVAKDDKTLYPIRVKHLGKETYTLFAPTLQNREDWCNKIIEARTKHAAALFAQNAEPFKLRVMADSAFAYEGGVGGQKSITIKGTPLDRAIRDVEKMYANAGRPSPVCRAKVNCATSFNQPGGKQMVAVGTDFGVFISEMDDPRGWQRVINNPRVTQIAVLEDFALFLLISDKALIAYHLDVVCPINGVPPPSDNVRRAPQKLSGSRDVGFFATGRIKDRMLVFYKKRDGISSTFKVLEPVLQKSSEKKSRFPLRSGKTEFFRDFEEFYIPTECMGMNIFHSSLAISTQRGFEILNLDKKQPISIPDLEASHVQMIASHLSGQKPLGMFRLSESEFLLVYEEYGVYVNKHGDISRSVIMEFVGRAKSAALYGPYVLLFDTDFVEIRNAQNGRLRQVIAGRDVKCLDDTLVGGTAGKRTVKVAMQHPEVEKVQIVVELVLNEGLRE